MMTNKWLLLLLAAVTVIMISPGRALAQEQDVSYGVHITNTASLVAANAVSPADATTDTPAGAISGDTLQKPTETAAGGVGETVVFAYTITNTGNSADSYGVSMTNAAYGGGSSAWYFAMFTGADTMVMTGDPGETLPLGLVGEDGQQTFYVAIGISSVAVNAPNGSSLTLNFNVRSETAATTEYLGDNGIVYAEATANTGANNVGQQVVTVAGAAFYLSKSCTGASVNNGWALAIPGASLYYGVGYVNDGTGAGDSVAMVDTIDTATQTFSDTFTNGDSIAVSPNSGWGIQYGAADGSYVDDPAVVGLANIKYLRWFKQTVPSNETAVVRYRVTVR